jgi:hypothetical protein
MPLAGCGKTEQGSRSDSDPFTSGFGYVHGQNEFFRSLLEDRGLSICPPGLAADQNDIVASNFCLAGKLGHASSE